MMERKARFKPGDLVYLKTGHAPQVVLEVKSAPLHSASTGFMIRCAYTRWFTAADRCSESWRTETDFNPYLFNPDLHDYEAKTPHGRSSDYSHQFAVAQQQKDDSLMGNKLYQTLEEKPRFGTFLTRNSTGKLVLEMKGSNDVLAFDPSELEEVKPYTVSIQFVGAKNTSFEAPKGLLKEGDLVLFSDYSLGVVTGINTGFSGSVALFPEDARRILTEKLGGETSASAPTTAA